MNTLPDLVPSMVANVVDTSDHSAIGGLLLQVRLEAGESDKKPIITIRAKDVIHGSSNATTTSRYQALCKKIIDQHRHAERDSSPAIYNDYLVGLNYIDPQDLDWKPRISSDEDLQDALYIHHEQRVLKLIAVVSKKRAYPRVAAKPPPATREAQRATSASASKLMSPGITLPKKILIAKNEAPSAKQWAPEMQSIVSPTSFSSLVTHPTPKLMGTSLPKALGVIKKKPPIVKHLVGSSCSKISARKPSPLQSQEVAYSATSADTGFTMTSGSAASSSEKRPSDLIEEAIARLEALSMEHPSRTFVALLSGYKKPSSAGFKKQLGALKS